jgi:hypothetical protein
MLAYILQTVYIRLVNIKLNFAKRKGNFYGMAV